MSGYIGTQPVPQATQTRDAFTATNNQTSFPTSGYTPEFLDVFLNGVKLAAADYTATNGSDVVLAAGATTGDILEVVSYGTFEVLNPTFDGNVTFTGNASFGDNDKAIFGDGSDLQIYHYGGNSFISESGSGSLFVNASNLVLRNTSGEYYFYGNSDGAVNLYHNNASKLATTSTGIDVTGTVTSDGLTVAQASGANILLESTTTGATTGDIFGEIEFKTNDSNSAGIKGKIDSYSEGGVGNGALRLFTGNTTGLHERMRIDSSGNLLVGKTTTAVNTGGCRLGSFGAILTRTDGSEALRVNRVGSDGMIVKLDKDGATVGNIGTFGGTTYFSSNTHAIMINGTAITPSLNTGNRVDGAMDLGASGYRFKDAYLSGGIYLGGTGAANKLDDYEEGTWTPVINDGTYSYSFRRGHYVRVGKMVYAHVGLKINTASSVGGSSASISGLPFLTESYGGYQEPHARVAVAGFCVTANLSSHLSFFTGNNGTIMYARTSANNNDTAVNSNALWQNGTFIKLTMLYTTNA